MRFSLVSWVLYLIPLGIGFANAGENETIYVQNCFSLNQINGKLTWPRALPLEMVAYTSADYDQDFDLDLAWRVYQLNTKTKAVIKRLHFQNNQGPSFLIPSYTLRQGLYKINATSKTQPAYKMEKECYVLVPPEPCSAVISGGTTIWRRPKEVVEVDGSVSKDFCYSDVGKKNSLTYRWKCTQKKGGGLCRGNDLGQGSQLRIPVEQVVEGEEFYVTLTVRNEDGWISSTNQEIVVKQNVRHAKIKCERNCPPWPRTQRTSVFSASCWKYCDHDCEAKWTAYSGDPKEPGWAMPWACTGSMVCSIDILRPIEMTIAYVCQGANVSGYAAMKINYKPETDMSCRIDPSVGDAFNTQFQVTCVLDSERETIQTIEVYRIDYDNTGNEYKDKFITSWCALEEHKFRLPPNTKTLLVRASSRPDVYTDRILQVDVSQEGETDSLLRIEHLYMGKGNHSVKHSMQMNRQKEALDRITNIWNKINNLERHQDEAFKFFLYTMRVNTVDDLLQMRADTVDKLMQMAKAVQDLFLRHDDPGPGLNNLLSLLCKKLAVEYAEHYDNPYLMPEKKSNFARLSCDDNPKTWYIILYVCYNRIFEICTKKLTEEKTQVPYTTETQVTEEASTAGTTGHPDFKVIAEDYEDYKDYGDEFYTNLQNLEEAGSNIVEVATLVGEVMADSMGKQEQKLFVTQHVNISVYKLLGMKYKDIVKVEGVTVLTSQDIVKSKNEFLLTLMSWKKNIFWWSRSGVKPTTVIADVAYKNPETKTVKSDFDSPNVVIFEKLRTNDDIQGKSYSIELPSSSNGKHQDWMEDYINIHRIDLLRHQSLCVDFHGLRDEKFQIVVKNFEVPVMRDFSSDSVPIDANNTYYCRGNDNDYDSWYYVGVLPRRGMVKAFATHPEKSRRFNYTVSFSAPTCYQWTFDETWQRTCKSDTANKTHIKCNCYHLSILAGTVEAVTSTLMRSNDVEITWDVEAQQVIFWSVFAMFSCYCILLLYGKRKHEMYFAADNDYNERYAYLIMVRTGRFRQITSRIVMKMVGSTRESRPHLLNYPDPYHRIFQRGSEDWIVITTSQCLGDIKRIELWHDYFGLKPAWYCKGIEICDIQTQEKWIFKVNSLIAAHCEYKIKVAALSQPEGRLRRLWTVLSLKGEPNVWNIFDDDIHRVTPFIQRLLFVYSKLSTALLAMLVWHGLPVMDVSDAIDAFNSHFDEHVVKMAFGGSFISFMVHLVQNWIIPRATIPFAAMMIVVSNTILLVFGFWIPFCSSMRIVIAWLIGVLVDIVIFDNALKLIRRLFYGAKLLDTNRGISYKNIAEEIEVQREALHRRFESAHLETLKNMTVPLKGRKLRHRKREEVRRSKLTQQLKDLLMFGIYILLLHVIVILRYDPLIFRQHDVLRDMFSGELTNTKPLSQARFISDMYDYLNMTLVEVLHSAEWYPNFKDDTNPGMMMDRSNKYIGVTRIKQHRVVNEGRCDVVARSLSSPNTTCAPVFSTWTEERRTFEDGWDQPTNYISVQKRMSTIWIYSLAAREPSGPYTGHLTTYPDGGYVAFMGRKKRNSMANLNVIKNARWIDRFTRSIVIETLTYNVNYNMFSSVTVLIERGASGYVHSVIKVEPVRMMIGNELESSFLMATVAFLLWLAVIFLNKTRAIVRERLTYLKNFWSFFDMLIIVICLATMAIYVVRNWYVGQLTEDLENVKHNQFIHYAHLFHLDMLLNMIGTLLVCASTVRLWKLVRFYKMFKMFEKTLLLAIGQLLGLSLHHFIFLGACTIVLHIILGEKNADFYDRGLCFKTMVKMYFHSYTYTDIYSMPRQAIAFLVIYTLVSKTLYFTYIVIAVLAHYNAREFFAKHHETSYSVTEWIKEEWRFLVNIFTPRRAVYRETAMRNKFVYSKSQKYLYANGTSIRAQAMYSMTVVVAIVLHKKLHTEERGENLSERQKQLMARLCHYFLSEHIRGDKKELFYKCHQGGVLKMVDARRMDRAKHIVEEILGVTAKIEKRERYIKAVVMRRTMLDLDKAQRKLGVCLHALENIEFLE